MSDILNPRLVLSDVLKTSHFYSDLFVTVYQQTCPVSPRYSILQFRPAFGRTRQSVPSRCVLAGTGVLVGKGLVEPGEQAAGQVPSRGSLD